MNSLLDALSINSLGHKILYPLLELNKEIESISLDRHRIRSCFKIIISILFSIALTKYALSNYKLMEVIRTVIDICNFSKETQPFLSISMCIILCCNISTFIGDLSTKLFCQIRYGEPEFYLTPRRLSILEKKLQEQINQEINKDNIKDVVEFCIKNFYKENSQELGGKKEDWRKTIESLIYEGDLEHFIDQQRALLLKKQQLEAKASEIISSNYPQISQDEIEKNYGSINSSQTNLTFSNSSAMLRQSHSAPVELYKVVGSGLPIIIHSPPLHTKNEESTPIVTNEKIEEYFNENMKEDSTASINQLIQNHLKELTTEADNTEKMLYRNNPITKFCCLNCNSTTDNILLLYDSKMLEHTGPLLYSNVSQNPESIATNLTPRNRAKHRNHINQDF